MITSRRFYHGWLIVAAVFLSGALIIGGSQYAFGAFVQPLEKDFGWTRTQINAALSFGALSNLMAPLLGRLIDKHGARPVMLVSLSLVTVSFLLRPFMTELWHWYLLTVIQFMGIPGAVFLPAGKLVGVWFERTRGRVVGIAAMGNNVGGFILPPLAGFIVGYASWHWAYLSFGLIGIAVTIFAYLVVSDTPKGKAEYEASLDRVGSRQSNAKFRVRARAAVPSFTVREALKTRAFYAAALGLIAANFAFSTALTQMVPHLVNEGFTLEKASLILSVFAVFALIGKILFGYLSDRLATRYVMIISLTVQVVGMLILVIAPRSFLIWIFIPVYGVAFGGLGPLITLLVQDTFGIRYYGSIQGLLNLTSVVSFLGGPLMAGLFYDATGSYRPTFIVVSILFVIGSLVLTQAKHPTPHGEAAGGR